MKKIFKRLLKAQKRSNEKGFTLLELLIVVAILATIAGTASMAYNDIDKRASAAAHVAMMDELNKGIRTYRAVQRDVLPTRFDSLMVGADVAGFEALATVEFVIAEQDSGFAQDAAAFQLNADVVSLLNDSGITELRYINEAALPAGQVTNGDANDENCDNAYIEALVKSQANAVVAGNLFLSAAANGCGTSRLMTTAGTNQPWGAFWVGDTERLTGQQVKTGIVEFSGANLGTANGEAMLLLGMGPSCSLFDTRIAGGMTTVPVYRHVAAHAYNRFIAVLAVGNWDTATSEIIAADKIHVVAIVDGALDTKEEELGEWDGQRAT